MSETIQNLIYAIKDGELVFIDDVENGDKCGCVCPACGESLRAKNNGSERIHHFAHKPNSTCKYGYETSLHYLAKEIIEEAKCVLLPGIAKRKRDKTRRPTDDQLNRIRAVIYHKDPFLVKCDEVALEKKVSGFIPDIVIKSNDRCYLIEIAVTHFVDKDKLEKIKKVGLPLVEINLRKLNKRLITKEELKKILFSGIYSEIDKYWVYNKETDELYSEAEEEYRRQQEQKNLIKYKKQQEALKRQEYQKQEPKKERKIPVAPKVDPNYKMHQKHYSILEKGAEVVNPQYGEGIVWSCNNNWIEVRFYRIDVSKWYLIPRDTENGRIKLKDS